MPQFIDFPGANVGGTPGADYDGLEFPLTGNPSQQAGSLAFMLRGDGTWNCPVPHYVGTENGNWFDPTTVGIGNDYEGRFTPTGFNTDPGSFTANDAATWENLGSDLSFVFGLSGSFVSDGGTLLVEIRDVATHTTVATGTITMTIDLT